MTILPISETCRTRNLPPRKQAFHERRREDKAAKRQYALCQAYHDALTPIVDRYEAQQPRCNEHGYVMVMIKLDEIINAQRALSVDIYA